MRTLFIKLTTLFTLFIVGTITLTGCSTSTAQKNGKTISHLGGETLISNIPQKVIALEFSFVDNLYQLGIKPIGIADDGDSKRIIEPIRTYVNNYTSVGKRAQPNLETIQSLKPDLIIADAKRHTEIYKELQAIAPTILIKSLEGNYQELEQSFKTIGTVFNQEAKVDEVISRSNNLIEETKNKLNTTLFQTKSILAAVPDSKSLNIHTSSSYLGNIFDKLKLQNSTSSQNVYEEATLEQLVNKKPDIIIYIRKSSGSIVDTWKESPLYQNIPAVQKHNVFEVDTEVWSRFRGYESLNTIIHDFERIGNELKS